MKKGIYIVITLLFMILLCGCENEAYKKGTQLKAAGKYEDAYNIFIELDNYKDSAKYADECCYTIGKNLFEKKDYSKAITWFTQIEDYEDSKNYIKGASIELAYINCDENKFDEALEIVEKLPDDAEVTECIQQCNYRKAEQFVKDKKYNEAEIIIQELEKEMDVKNLAYECNYGQCIALFEAKQYVKAKEEFLKLDLNEDIKEYLFKIAKELFIQKEYVHVKEICNILGDYKTSLNLLEDSKMRIKYQNYKYAPFKLEDGEPVELNEDGTIESEMYEWYRTWYNSDTGTEIEYIIDKYERGGKEYGIYTAYTWPYYETDLLIVYYYLDEPDKLYAELVEPDYTYYGQMYLNSWDIGVDGVLDGNYMYTALTAWEMEQLIAEREALEAEIRREENKNAVFEQAKAEYNRRYRSVYSDPSLLYSSVKYPDMSQVVFSIDEYANIYTVTFTVEENSNVFDIFGTSISRRTVQASYQINGTSMQLIAFLVQ